MHANINEIPKWWLCSAKIPPYGEGLADKGFEHTDTLFAWFNRVCCPKVMKARKLKQYHELELPDKGICCTGRYTIEVNYSFLENNDILKDGVPYENISLLPYALEWGHGCMNLQQPLRKPGVKSGLPSNYWEEINVKN